MPTFQRRRAKPRSSRLPIASTLGITALCALTAGVAAAGSKVGPRTDYAGGSTPRGQTIADLMRDGNAEWVMANDTSPGTVSVMFGDGSGAFGPLGSYVTGDDPIMVAVGDFNGDGMPDLVTANHHP